MAEYKVRSRHTQHHVTPSPTAWDPVWFRRTLEIRYESRAQAEARDLADSSRIRAAESLSAFSTMVGGAGATEV